ncbi:hypothetical protein HELRODRAFT_83593 [Helobdella robusta]|uniref:Uncharacterized protein n=1 Tax=Helobdella robusta TaxID=6412 RepID=T1G576_HELRO|nr:hypothetical protein HELRODRAFT_83593 [Helobdella robusta]ESN99995.1 hypothetical protein HELRODRAFT_83593 [Helobdella robusta]
MVKGAPTKNRDGVRWGHQDNGIFKENGGLTANIKKQNGRFPPRFNNANAVNRNIYSADSNSRPSNSTNWRSKPDLESVPRDEDNLNVIDQDRFDVADIKIVTSNNNANDNSDGTFNKSSSSAANKGTTNWKNYPTKREYINGNVRNYRINSHFNSQQSSNQNNKIIDKSINAYNNNNYIKDENTLNSNSRSKYNKNMSMANSNNLISNNYNNKTNSGIKRDNINIKNDDNSINFPFRKVIDNENWDELGGDFNKVDDNNLSRSNKKIVDEDDDEDDDLKSLPRDKSLNIIKRPNDESQRGVFFY